MDYLIAGMIVFIGIHLVPSFAGFRRRLNEQYGAKRYRVVFSLIALAGLLLIIFGKSQSQFIALWNPPTWGRHAALSLMPFSLMLLAASHMPSNIKRITPHPMLWGVILWAALHLLANGDLASLILFGGLGAYAVFDIWSANRRGSHRATVRYPLTKDALVIAAGLIAYGALLYLHPILFGVSARA